MPETAWGSLMMKARARELAESNPSITVKLKCAGSLCIERDGNLFALYYINNSEHPSVRRIGSVRRGVIEGALPIMGFGTATIETKIGNLELYDRREILRLKKWMKV